MDRRRHVDPSTSTVTYPRPLSRRSTPSSTSIRTSSRTKSGLPSLDARSRVEQLGRAARRCRAGRARAGRSTSASSPSSTTTTARVRRLRRAPDAVSRSSGRASRDQQHRRVAGPLREVLDEIEQHRLGPVDVVEDRAPTDASRAIDSKMRRTAQNVSSAVPGSPAPRSAPARGSDALAVGSSSGMSDISAATTAVRSRPRRWPRACAQHVGDGCEGCRSGRRRSALRGRARGGERRRRARARAASCRRRASR